MSELLAVLGRQSPDFFFGFWLDDYWSVDRLSRCRMTDGSDEGSEVDVGIDLVSMATGVGYPMRSIDYGMKASHR